MADEYARLLHTIEANHPDQGGEYRRAMAQLQVQLVKDQIASAQLIAKAADTTAGKITRATWILSAATVILAVATVVLVVVTATHH